MPLWLIDDVTQTSQSELFRDLMLGRTESVRFGIAFEEVVCEGGDLQFTMPQ